uniref:Uncharacterized protein n=1 Tax=Musca domestica TaxID=7370 RepID=A0A1I8M3L6_MUSDO
MGNVCSSGQSKKKDSISEKSEDSYHINKDEPSKELGENQLAPLADQELLPDIAKNNATSPNEINNEESDNKLAATKSTLNGNLQQIFFLFHIPLNSFSASQLQEFLPISILQSKSSIRSPYKDLILLRAT